MASDASWHAPARHDLPLDALAARIGEELVELAELAAGVQLALSDCRFAPETSASAIRGLQGIDKITQVLDDLARLMADLAGEIPPQVRLHAVPILSRLRLNELVATLGGDAAGAKGMASRKPRHLESEGDVTWF